MSLYRVTVYYEAESSEDVDALATAIEGEICPYHASESHDCPHRWMLITSELDDKDAAEVEELLNS
jgi:hypothetical protein